MSTEMEEAEWAARPEILLQLDTPSPGIFTFTALNNDIANFLGWLAKDTDGDWDGKTLRVSSEGGADMVFQTCAAHNGIAFEVRSATGEVLP